MYPRLGSPLARYILAFFASETPKTSRYSEIRPRLARPRSGNALSLILFLSVVSGAPKLGGCNLGGGNSPQTYTVGGSVSGLAGSGLVLQDNGGGNLSMSGSGQFTFTTALDNGAAYDVTVLSQPTNRSQTCTVKSGSGTIESGNITNVSVTCVTNTYTVSGTVTGLAGSGLILEDNGGNNLAVSTNGLFSFSSPVASGSGYNVTVFSEPTNLSQTCAVSSGTGTVGGSNITNVAVNCTTDTFNVSGTVTGLGGSGLVLQDNSGDNLAISTNGTFSFATAIASGSGFDVTVLTQPSNPARDEWSDRGRLRQ